VKEILGKMQVEMRIDNYVFEVTCHIVPNFYTSCEAIVGLDVLSKIIMKVDGGTFTLIGLWEQELHWAQLSEINVVEEIDQIEICRTNQDNKSKITKLIAEYKINKSKEIGMKFKYHIAG